MRERGDEKKEGRDLSGWGWDGGRELGMKIRIRKRGIGIRNSFGCDFLGRFEGLEDWRTDEIE